MDIYDYVDKQEIEIHKTLQGITFIDEDDIIPSNNCLLYTSPSPRD